MALPCELRQRVYRILLVHREPVGLEFKIGERRFKTRLGMAPQICCTSTKVAFESLPILYSENTFHFASFFDNASYCAYQSLEYNIGFLSPNYFSYYFSAILIDTFERNNPTDNCWVDEALVQTLQQCCSKCVHLKTILLNLPESLQILTTECKRKLLNLKALVPDHIAVEFRGAKPDIVAEVAAAWLHHVPEQTKELESPKCVCRTANRYSILTVSKEPQISNLGPKMV